MTEQKADEIVFNIFGYLEEETKDSDDNNVHTRVALLVDAIAIEYAGGIISKQIPEKMTPELFYEAIKELFIDGLKEQLGRTKKISDELHGMLGGT